MEYDNVVFLAMFPVEEPVPPPGVNTHKHCSLVFIGDGVEVVGCQPLNLGFEPEFPLHVLDDVFVEEDWHGVGLQVDQVVPAQLRSILLELLLQPPGHLGPPVQEQGAVPRPPA